MQTLFQGIIAYPVTPFTAAGGDVDLPRLRQLIERLIADGVHSIAPLGSTGESAYLQDGEWDAVAATSLAAVAKRVPTVVGISDLTTAGAMRRARFAEKQGADAVMVLPVSYWKLSEEEIVRHVARIGDAPRRPWIYLIVATGDIYEDVPQAQAEAVPYVRLEKRQVAR